MRNLILILCLSMALILSCQKKANKSLKTTVETINPIKVYLLGTIHFAQTDSTYNVLDEKHQKSIEDLCKIIANQKPDKIFVERQPEFEYQNKLDSLFQVYIKMIKPLRAKNEIFQVAFRTAKKLGHSKVYQCDHPGRYGSLNSVAEDYAIKNNQKNILESKRFGTVKRYDQKVDEEAIMQNSTLLEYLQWLNSPKVMESSHAAYITNFPQIGSNNYYDINDRSTLIGAKVTTDWYRRNIMIYTKMINQVTYKKDKAIFLLIGADHIPIIKYLFETNPYFEVIETSKWLKN